MVTPSSIEWLPGRAHRVVERHHLGDVLLQPVAGPLPHLLGDGDEQVDLVGHGQPVAAQGVQRAQGGGHAGLAVEVPGVDVPAVGHDRQRVEGHEVAHRDAEGRQVGGVGARLVDPHLDVVPAGRLHVDLVAVGVAAGQEREHGARVGAGGVVGQDRDPAALGEARAVRADRHDGQPPVRLEVTDHAADRVGVGHDGPRALLRPGRRASSDPRRVTASSTGQLGQLVAEQLHDGVGAPGRAGGAQQAQQQVEHPRHVDLGEGRHRRTVPAPCRAITRAHGPELKVLPQTATPPDRPRPGRTGRAMTGTVLNASAGAVTD